MSASDSDYSIDWLASDDEESELEPECQKRAAEQVWCLDARQRLRDQVRDGTLVAKDGEERERHPSTGCDFRSTCLDSCGMEQNWASESPPSRKRLGQKRPHSPGLAEHHNQLTANQREKNLLFASKCMELQCYIPPLSSILNGLRSGRYRERLSSFQESVAMDRIQRIMGVLQNPHMGERYVNIVLKMEEMLKSWFPHIKPQNHSTEEWRADTTPSKKQKHPRSLQLELTNRWPDILLQDFLVDSRIHGSIYHSKPS
uniref:Circadian-associated transcriptional repressor-like n=1 Tax=Denticeps clupeoides TaxID=299321 RepID=A0AAY4BX97_9TELE